MTMRSRVTLIIVLGTVAVSAVTGWSVVSARQKPAWSPTTGQSSTQLADGRWLLLGGESAAGPTRGGAIVDPATGTITNLDASMTTPREGHTATVLADGTVLIVGGRGPLRQLAATAELFDPQTGAFMPLGMDGGTPRADHTATLLSDGRVLVVGGTASGDRVASDAEIWDVSTQHVAPVGQLRHARSGQTATLLGDGSVVLTSGTDASGRRVAQAEIIDPSTGRTADIVAPVDDGAPAHLTASTPADGALDVSVTTRMALRFSRPLRVESVNAATVTLTGPDGPVDSAIVPAEGGRLAFLWPRVSLRHDSVYTVTMVGPSDVLGGPLLAAPVTFTTAAEPVRASDGSDEEGWVPDERSRSNGWRTERPPSPWESLPPLLAEPGVTAISGRVLTLDGRPLAGVALGVEGDATVHSDRTGRFLLKLTASATARRVLQIDGAPASRPNRRYGFFEHGSIIRAGTTNVLPFTIWMPKLDTAHQVTIPSPTTNEVVVTTPYIPGLELHIPPNTVITGEDGKPVRQISITPIPVDRPPFPLPTNFIVPVYFTIQPGGAYVHTGGSGLKGAQLVYPNYKHAPAGQRVQFYHYDPDVKDWYVYGMGTVNATATQVKPDATTRLYAFTGAMFNDGDPTPADGKPAGAPTRQDPVDPSTGIFVMSKTDLYLPDVIPLAMTRTYNSGDGFARPVGRSMTHAYAIFLHSEQQYQQVDLILPEGGKVHYVRTSPGTGWTDAVFVHKETSTTSATPTTFYKSVISWNGNGWDLKLIDGTVFVFGELAPLQAIRDRYGNTVTITHANGQSGNITQVTSPNGRWISFTYDGSNRITQAKDNIGRIVAYTYDANGNLSTVTDPENGVTTYTYDASNRMVTIKDGRNIAYVTNQYQNGRISRQSLADSAAVYQSAYTLDGAGKITQTDITDPRGNVERLTFNADHYIVTDVEAVGASVQRTTTTERQAGSNLVTAVTDGLGRRTEFTYDANGHVLTTTRLAGTADAVTTTYTYEPVFGQLLTVTDPLNHTSTLGYDTLGRLTSATDPLGHQTTLGWNAVNQLTSITDALQHASQFGYTGGDLTSVTDPASAVRRQFVDGAGRVVQTTDALGRQTRSIWDKLNRITAVTDPLGGQTSFAYDPNGNLLTLTDALTHTTTYAYDANDRVATRTDPLQRMASYQYDANGHVTQATDRKGQVTSYQYDALDRLSRITYADASMIDYTYDLGDRLTQIVDSVNGTITRAYDGLDRLMSEASPSGTVSYTYDADGRRATMTVAGQGTVTYGYDDAHRLTSITQGTNAIGMTYDDANRRSTLTLANGIVATYGYDSADHLTSLAYTLNGNPVGDLTYAYDLAGQRTSVGGSLARTGLPQALGSATVDAGNQLVASGGTTLLFDSNGNLTSDGTTSYTWNARNQLVGLSGAASASFQYDGFGRRRGKTVNGTTTNFLHDGLNLVQELSGGGTPTANLLTGLGVDETFARTDGSGTSTLLVDALGSTLELADGSGTAQTQYTFDPFGASTLSGAASSNATQFTGRENDGTGLYYYRARFYSPDLHRFISEDPIGSAGGINHFAYVADAPTGYTDPLGLKPSAGFGDDGDGGDDAGADDKRWPPAGCRAQCLNDWFAAHPEAIKLGMLPIPDELLGEIISSLPQEVQVALTKLGIYPTKIGGGGSPQFYDPATGQYLSNLAPVASNIRQFLVGLVQGYGSANGAPVPPPLSAAGGLGQVIGSFFGNIISVIK
jgi:RHS repeat-associated protein